MKLSTYPPFMAIGFACLQLPDNKSARPDLKVKVGAYINYWNDVHSALVREAKWRLELLGVPLDKLAIGYFDTEDVEYTALEPRGVRRAYGEPVEAFYHHEAKDRARLICQRRLVPDSYEDMVAMYGKKSTAQEVVPA